jgi:hypothetical protein
MIGDMMIAKLRAWLFAADRRHSALLEEMISMGPGGSISQHKEIFPWSVSENLDE